MDENQGKQTNLIDTTDCLEAVGVFRGWKNGLFVIAILCLFLLQGSFWLVNLGYVRAEENAKSREAVIASEETKETIEASEQPAAVPDVIEKAAKEVAGEPDQPVEAVEKQKPRFHFLIDMKFEQLAWLIRLLNFVLIPTAVLYCLTMLFSLKVSLLGRLGGINHISRAFFISLVALVLLLPWQRFFGGVIVGAMYRPEELLLSSWSTIRSYKIFGPALYYLRFSVYWLLVLLLLIFSHSRSFRWAKAILRRLEVI